MVISWQKNENNPHMAEPAAELTPGPPPDTATRQRRQHAARTGRRGEHAWLARLTCSP